MVPTARHTAVGAASELSMIDSRSSMADGKAERRRRTAEVRDGTGALLEGIPQLYP